MDPQFKLTFDGVSIAFLLLLMGLGYAAMFFKEPMSHSQDTFTLICSHGLFMCLGFMIGGANSARQAAH
jgi:hypothetical protein